MPGEVQKQQYNTSSSGLILQQCLVIGLSGGTGINLQSWEWFWTVTVKNVGNQRCLCKQKAHRRWHTKTSDSSWKQLLHLRISVSEVNQCHSSLCTGSFPRAFSSPSSITPSTFLIDFFAILFQVFLNATEAFSLKYPIWNVTELIPFFKV